jgi:hypothetical protein
MNWKSKLALGVLTALAMMLLTYALPRGGTMRDAAVVQFPVTVGIRSPLVPSCTSIPGGKAMSTTVFQTPLDLTATNAPGGGA